MHLDQNEKLAMYGVTHVIAVDGFSRKIVGMITIPVKNPIAIYNALMKPLWLMAAGESRPWYRVYLSGDRATSCRSSIVARSSSFPAEYFLPKPF